MLPEDFNEKFEALIEDVKVIKNQVTKIDELAEGVAKLQAKTEELRAPISTLEEEKFEINVRLNEQEQYSRRDNLIISGIPKEPNENVRSTVTKIAEKLGVKLHEYDVCTAHRLSNKGEAPAIVAKMNNHDKKNSLILEGKKKVLSANQGTRRKSRFADLYKRKPDEGDERTTSGYEGEIKRYGICEICVAQ